MLVAPESLESELSAKPPIVLVHGGADEMIPAEALFAAVGALGALALSVRWHVSVATGHAIDEAGLRLGADFLVRALAT
jgi:phospholipase/carboxylesterase